jgi:ribosomal-protein-alanine N-acetyltransferase
MRKYSQNRVSSFWFSNCPRTRSPEIIHTLQIREATLLDVPIMMALEREASTAAHWRKDDYLKVFEPTGVSRLALVVQREAHIAGFLIASASGDEWEIENVVIKNDTRRRGLGLRLVEELTNKAQARGARNLLLEVRESNEAARKLYEKCGFEIVGRRRGYYANPEEDAVVYRREIVIEPFG